MEICLRLCDSLSLYNICSYESNITSKAPRVKLHTYTKFTSCYVDGSLRKGSLSCDLCRESDETKGKIRTRKMSTMKEVTIGKFMSDVYLPGLEKYVYHIHHVKMLFKGFCGSKRRTVFMWKPSSLLIIRDYDERLSAHFDLEI